MIGVTRIISEEVETLDLAEEEGLAFFVPVDVEADKILIFDCYWAKEPRKPEDLELGDRDTFTLGKFTFEGREEPEYIYYLDMGTPEMAKFYLPYTACRAEMRDEECSAKIHELVYCGSSLGEAKRQVVADLMGLPSDFLK